MLSSDIAHSGLLEQIVQPGPNCALPFQGSHFSEHRVRIRFAEDHKFSAKNCINSSVNRRQRKRAPENRRPSLSLLMPPPRQNDQRFENWNDLRALARPYFLRSTTRESRV